MCGKRRGTAEFEKGGNHFRELLHIIGSSGPSVNYVTQIQTNFIWKIIPPKTKHKTLILNHIHGGLK